MYRSKLTRFAFAAALAIGIATAGHAQGNGHRNRDDRGRNEQSWRGNSPDNRAGGGNPSDRGYARGRGYERERAADPRAGYGRGQRYERGAGPDHQYYTGNRLPAPYRGSTYVVHDWRGHHLHAPARGYHWVQTGTDYVLVAIATGIIVQLILDN